MVPPSPSSSWDASSTKGSNILECQFSQTIRSNSRQLTFHGLDVSGYSRPNILRIATSPPGSHNRGSLHPILRLGVSMEPRTGNIQPWHRRGQTASIASDNMDHDTDPAGQLQAIAPQSTLQATPTLIQRRVRLRRRRIHFQVNPKYEVEFPVILLSATGEPHTFRAVFSTRFPSPMVYPSVLRTLGITPMDLPPTLRKRVMCPIGNVKPELYTGLVIEQPLLGILTNSGMALVLGDKVPYREVDIFLGQQFLDDNFDGKLPQSVPTSSGTSGDNALLLQRQADESTELPQRDPTDSV